MRSRCPRRAHGDPARDSIARTHLRAFPRRFRVVSATPPRPATPAAAGPAARFGNAPIGKSKLPEALRRKVGYADRRCRTVGQINPPIPVSLATHECRLRRGVVGGARFAVPFRPLDPHRLIAAVRVSDFTHDPADQFPSCIKLVSFTHCPPSSSAVRSRMRWFALHRRGSTNPQMRPLQRGFAQV